MKKKYKTKFRDKNGRMIRTGDICRAFDSTGKEWIALIEYRKEDNVYVFASNYDTWLHDYYARELEVIKKKL